jgi:hypothetical protein
LAAVPYIGIKAATIAHRQFAVLADSDAALKK